MIGVEQKPIVLVVDDETSIRHAIGRILEHAGYTHFEASDPAAAMGLADLYRFSLVLCDINMPGGSGLDMLRALRRRHPNIAVVMVTGIDNRGTASMAAEFGAVGYVTKPFEAAELLDAVASGLRRRETVVEHHAPRRSWFRGS
jgi:DNA-binding response OmpR family regulator